MGMQPGECACAENFGQGEEAATMDSAFDHNRRAVAVLLLTVTGIVAVGQTYVVLGMLAPMGIELGATPAAVTAATTVFGIAYAVGFLAAGPFAARFGARRVLLVGLAGAALAAGASAVPATIDGELAARSVQGLMTASFAPTALIYVSQNFPPRTRTFAISALTTSFLASAVVMPLAAAPIANSLGWRTVFLSSALALMVLGILLAAVLRPGNRPVPVPMFTAIAVLPRSLVRPRQVVLYLATSALLGSYVALFTVLQLSDSHGVTRFPGGLAGIRTATLPVLMLIALASVILYRLPAIWRGVGGLSIAAISAAVVALAGGSPGMLAAGVLVFVGAIALAAPALIARIIEVAQPAETAGATALYGTFMFAGGSLGPLLAAASGGSELRGALLPVSIVAALGAVLVAVTWKPSQGAALPATGGIEGVPSSHE
jgi:MFS family permease